MRYRKAERRRTEMAAAKGEETSVDWTAILAAVVAALEGYPEARAAVVKVLEEME